MRPLQSSAPLEAAHALLRQLCPAMMEDRYLAPDIAAASTMVRDGSLAQVLGTLRAVQALPALWTPA